MMRQLWTLIESTQVNTLLQLDDLTLVQWLLKQFTAQQVIDEHETSSLNTYINSRLPNPRYST
jgi:succinate dehydrogenase flavin-adding protein (antitoxin of CptAB toxin-antitoxin module)